MKGKPTRPQPYIKNYRQLRKVDSRRDRWLFLGYPIPNAWSWKHAYRYIKQIEQVIFRNPCFTPTTTFYFIHLDLVPMSIHKGTEPCFLPFCSSEWPMKSSGRDTHTHTQDTYQWAQQLALRAGWAPRSGLQWQPYLVYAHVYYGSRVLTIFQTNLLYLYPTYSWEIKSKFFSKHLGSEFHLKDINKMIVRSNENHIMKFIHDNS